MRSGSKTARAALLAGIAALVPLACSSGGNDALVGTWRGPDAGGGTIAFDRDGTASWILGDGADADTFDVEYALDPSASPTALDLTGFDHGPYAGHALYCIVDFPAPEAFRLDCVPGDDPAARPASFGNQAIRFEGVADEDPDG